MTTINMCCFSQNGQNNAECSIVEEDDALQDLNSLPDLLDQGKFQVVGNDQVRQ